MATHHHCQQYQYHRRSFRRCDLRMPPSPTPLWVQVWCWVHGQMCAGFSNLQTLMSVGEYGNRVHSIFPTKLSASDKPTRVATTRYGFAWTLWSSTMAMLAKDTNDDSSWKNARRRTITANKGTKQARMPATIRFLHGTGDHTPPTQRVYVRLHAQIQPFFDTSPFQFIKASSI